MLPSTSILVALTALAMLSTACNPPGVEDEVNVQLNNQTGRQIKVSVSRGSSTTKEKTLNAGTRGPSGVYEGGNVASLEMSREAGNYYISLSAETTGGGLIYRGNGFCNADPNADPNIIHSDSHPSHVYGMVLFQLGGTKIAVSCIGQEWKAAVPTLSPNPTASSP